MTSATWFDALHSERRSAMVAEVATRSYELFDRFLRADVLRADQEDDALHEPERVVQHEPLHLAVADAAPV